jgi:hypothetical protein
MRPSSEMRAGPSLRYRVTAAVLVIALITASVSAIVTPGLWRAVVALLGLAGAAVGITWMWRQDRRPPDQRAR